MMLIGSLVAIRARWSRPDTLVVYIFSATDPEYVHNLEYFVKEGMVPNDRCHYVVVIQQPGEDEEPLPELPQLPSNAQYVHHANQCYDWGTFGWLLESGLVREHMHACHADLRAWTSSCHVLQAHLIHMPLCVHANLDAGEHSCLPVFHSHELKCAWPVFPTCSPWHNALD